LGGVASLFGLTLFFFSLDDREIDKEDGCLRIRCIASQAGQTHKLNIERIADAEKKKKK
jgi:hypothetical protein